MSEPTREHVEAVAKVFSSDEDRCGVEAWTNSWVGEQIAKLLLTSTDPAVLDALAAALVNAGWLTEEGDWMRPCHREDRYDSYDDGPIWVRCGGFVDHKGDHEAADGHSWPRDDAGDDPEPKRVRLASEWRAES